MAGFIHSHLKEAHGKKNEIKTSAHSQSTTRVSTDGFFFFRCFFLGGERGPCPCMCCALLGSSIQGLARCKLSPTESLLEKLVRRVRTHKTCTSRPSPPPDVEARQGALVALKLVLCVRTRLTSIWGRASSPLGGARGSSSPKSVRLGAVHFSLKALPVAAENERELRAHGLGMMITAPSTSSPWMSLVSPRRRARAHGGRARHPRLTSLSRKNSVRDRLTLPSCARELPLIVRRHRQRVHRGVDEHGHMTAFDSLPSDPAGGRGGGIGAGGRRQHNVAGETLPRCRCSSRTGSRRQRPASCPPASAPRGRCRLCALYQHRREYSQPVLVSVSLRPGGSMASTVTASASSKQRGR